MATVYLHIGLPKTGSTAIQRLLCDNRELLESRSICFPDFGYRYPVASFRRNGHFLIANLGSETQRFREYNLPPDLYEDGMRKLEEVSKKFDTIILSDEGIWRNGFFQKDFWENLKEHMDAIGLEVRIIVYLRRQDLWLESYWAQSVKEGGTRLNFHDHIKYMEDLGYPLDYYAYMSRLASLFGKENLYIRVMEREQFHGEEHSLLSDFLDILGLSLSDGFTVQREVANTRLEGSYLEMRRVLNGLPEYHTFKHPLLFNIKMIQLDNPFGYDFKGYSFFGPGEQAAYRESFAESNQRLAREFLGREDGILFYEEPSDLPEMEVSDSDLLRDTILVYGRMIDILLQKNQKQKESLKKLRNEVRELRESSLSYRVKRKLKHLSGKKSNPPQ